MTQPFIAVLINFASAQLKPVMLKNANNADTGPYTAGGGEFIAQMAPPLTRALTAAAKRVVMQALPS